MLQIVILRDQSILSGEKLVTYPLSVDIRSHISVQLHPRQDVPQQKESTP